MAEWQPKTLRSPFWCVRSNFEVSVRAAAATCVRVSCCQLRESDPIDHRHLDEPGCTIARDAASWLMTQCRVYLVHSSWQNSSNSAIALRYWRIGWRNNVSPCAEQPAHRVPSGLIGALWLPRVNSPQRGGIRPAPTKTETNQLTSTLAGARVRLRWL